MKKLFALLLCFGLVGTMSFTIVGCDKGKTDAEKKAEKEKSKTDVKIKAIPDTTVKKGKDVTVPIELEADAPVSLTAKATGDGVSGTTTIKEKEKKADLKLTATDAAKDGTVTVAIDGTEKTKAASQTFKLKVE